ncbi:hypothetical protein [Burkholderia ubonensis]|uniref:hypothetical protein n=1 Tax=Burkholderia ubonensis TaxID=101571 RepID=UPI000AD3C557|nr:hypothetical protein [Burkholderia ubonensis]
MRFSCALLFAASLVTDIAHAAPDESLYRGMIGKSPIVLRFYQNDKQAIGRYFYRSQGIDIGLVPTVNAGEFVECSLSGGGDEPTACAEPTGVWSLSFASGSASGTWRKSAGAVATLPIRLERTSATCDANFNGSSATERGYDCLRVEGSTEISARKETSADRAITWRFITEKAKWRIRSAADERTISGRNANRQRRARTGVSGNGRLGTHGPAERRVELHTDGGIRQYPLVHGRRDMLLGLARRSSPVKRLEYHDLRSRHRQAPRLDSHDSLSSGGNRNLRLHERERCRVARAKTRCRRAQRQGMR